jgi:hypothetical protein
MNVAKRLISIASDDNKVFLLASICLAGLLLAPGGASAQTYYEERPPFEVYALASSIKTIDEVQRAEILSPAVSDCCPTGGAAGFRTGFTWNVHNIGLVSDVGVHRYSDHT